MKNRNLNHSDHWATPKDLYDKLNSEFGFDFDPCPLHAKFNGLKCDWGSSNFINPPYSLQLKTAFVKRAIKVSKQGARCVLLLPVSTSTKLFHEDILPSANDIRFLKGRVKFVGVNTKGERVSNKCGMHDSMVVILKTSENYEFMKSGSLITHNSHIDTLSDNLRRMLASSKKGLNVRVTNAVRTARQNNALHSTLAEYAKKLNDAGIPYKIIIGKKEIEGIWTLENLKALFRIIAKHLYDTQSTAKLSTAQMSECYKVFAERIGANTGVHTEWHSNEIRMLSDV